MSMIGIDEVGRGAWAGPLVVAGCYFTENPGFISELQDSKVLSAKKRMALEPQIKSSCIYKVVVIPPLEVDSRGLTECITSAILDIISVMPKTTEIILDGSFNFLKNSVHAPRTQVVVRADAIHPCVMAASIIAKVERDRIMKNYDAVMPEYGFLTNVGYGTKKHHDALLRSGASSIHRKSVRPVKAIL